MRNSFQGLFFVLIVSIIFGCQHDGNNNNTPLAPTSPFITSFQPKGTISGLIFNSVTNVPVANALISVGFEGNVKTTTSSTNGVFSFADVPAGSYKVVNGTSVLSGTYTLSVSLVNYNIAQTDPNKKYRDYYYSTVTITFTSLALGDSVPVGGMVGSVVMGISHLNTTLKGQIVDQDNQPVQNALVTLFDATVFPNIALGQIATGTNGEYQFNNIDNGLTIDITAKSSDGSLQGSLAGTFTLPANVMKDSLRTQVNAERIRITAVDNVAPFVISINPENQSDIATSSKITVTFSEPIKQNAYTRTDLPLGSTTIIDDITLAYLGFKKANANISYTMLWQNNNTQLVITPQGLSGSSKYSFDMRTAANSGKLRDLSSNALANNTAITGDFELLQFTTNGGTVAPAAPVLERRKAAQLYTPLNYTGGIVRLEWNYDAAVRSYNVYKKNSGGSFTLAYTNFYGLQLSDSTSSLVTPMFAVNPLSSNLAIYRVTAVSKDLVESAPSNEIIVGDEVLPKLLTATIQSLSATDNIFTLQFSEPLYLVNAKNKNNYTFTNTAGITFTIQGVEYVGYDNITKNYHVKLYVTTSANPITGYSIVIQNGLIDLAGWGIDLAFNQFTTVPAQPLLDLPVDNQQGVSSKPTVTWKAANGATSYHLQISTNNTFTAIVKDTNTIAGISATFNTNILNGTQYYWRVAANNSAGQGAYSNTNTFITIGIPTLLTPANGTVGLTLTPSLTWSAAAGASTYSVEVSVDPLFATTVVNQSGIGPATYTISAGALQANTLYYWRVTTINITTGATTKTLAFNFRTL